MEGVKQMERFDWLEGPLSSVCVVSLVVVCVLASISSIVSVLFVGCNFESEIIKVIIITKLTIYLESQ